MGNMRQNNFDLFLPKLPPEMVPSDPLLIFCLKFIISQLGLIIFAIISKKYENGPSDPCDPPLVAKQCY